MQRIEPNLPAADYRTYQITSPRRTHWRPASCEEAECVNYLNGWQTVIDESTDLGKQQAHHIRNVARRKYTEDRRGGSLTIFTFEAGQPCFAQHQAPTGRPELYIVRDGDWRGNPRGTEPYRHARPDDWVDDFATHQDRLSRLIEKG